jgi:hypothetical protein
MPAMTKKPADRPQTPSPLEAFAKPKSRRRRTLILPRHLAERADDKRLQGKPQERAYEILKRWADMEKQGHLTRRKRLSTPTSCTKFSATPSATRP